MKLRSAVYDPANLQFIYQADQINAIKVEFVKHGQRTNYSLSFQANFELESNGSLELSTSADDGACGSPLEVKDNEEDNIVFIAACMFGFINMQSLVKISDQVIATVGLCPLLQVQFEFHISYLRESFLSERVNKVVFK